MKEIGTISLSRMNNGAHFLYVSNILARAEANEQVNTKAAALVAALKDAVRQEDADLKLTQKSLLTDDIAKADDLRDSLFSGYKKAVDGFRDFPAEELAKAAKQLWQHLKDYAINPKMQLDRQTGLLMNFISDLEGKYAEQVEALSLTPFVTKLKEANEAVRQLTMERTNEKMTRTVGALKASRKVTDKAYNALVKMVNALATVEGDAEYANFIDYVNTEIAHYKREVLNQKTTGTKPSDGGSSSDGGNGGNTEGGGSGSGGDEGSGGDGGNEGGGSDGGDDDDDYTPLPEV